VLGDCFALLAAGAGPKPMKILEDQGIDVFIAEGTIKRSVDIVFGEGNTQKN
jgi:nitrogen fixation protein NifB